MTNGKTEIFILVTQTWKPLNQIIFGQKPFSVNFFNNDYNFLDRRSFRLRIRRCHHHTLYMIENKMRQMKAFNHNLNG